MHARLILVEGIPGSGKTSTARKLHRRLARDGHKSRWFREEDPNHPVSGKRGRPSEIRERPEWWLAGWRRVVASLAGSDEVLVLEGTAFQSTVRFLMADGVSVPEIRAYADAFVRTVREIDTRLIYVEPTPAEAWLRERVLPRRGDAWCGPVAAWTESTPFARERGWTGFDGMIRFWTAYRELCDSLLPDLDLPLRRFDPARRPWSHIHAEIDAWLALD